MNNDRPRGRGGAQMCNHCGLRLDADELISHLRERVAELEAALAGSSLGDRDRPFLVDTAPIFEKV
jgi:hypothetical protein